jgi:hypothetical protein
MEYPWFEHSAKADMVHEFTVDFADGEIIANGKRFPLGNFTAEVLNLPHEQIADLCVKSDEFRTLFDEKFPRAKENPALLSEIQESLNGVLDIVFELPLYRELDLDRTFTKRFMVYFQETDPEKFREMCAEPLTADAARFFAVLDRIAGIGQRVYYFNSYVSLVCDDYFEPLQTRSPKSYADAIMRFNLDTEKLNQFSGFPLFGLTPYSNVMFEYLPIKGVNGDTAIAERTVFEHYGDFLRTEFFRALKIGNAPRRCHNCGRYFLLTAGYNICYCNSIAPDQAKRTCRQIGAYRKRSGHVGRTPIQTEYEKTYNRLKTRKCRGKISAAKWNTAVAKAQEWTDKVARGETAEFDGVRELRGM